MAKKSGDQRVRILHLSDFHFSEKRSWDADPVFSGLVDIVHSLPAAGMAPDLVAITGDIAQAGKTEEYHESQTWLNQRLLPALPRGFTADRLLMVPGNHDVDRKTVNTICQSTQSTLLAANDELRIAEVLGDDDQRRVLLKRHDAYREFAGQFRSADDKPSVPWWSTSFNVRGTKLRIVGLCSSWMSCCDDDQGHLLVGRRQTSEVFRERHNADWSVALVHHPWSYLAEFDAFEVESVVHQECDLVMRGHLHRTQVRAIVNPDKSCLELAAGSCYAGSDYPNAFQLVELDREAGTATVHFWLWNGVKWIQDRNACPESVDGTATFRLKSGSGRTMDIKSVVSRIGRGGRSPADIGELESAIRSGVIVLATGQRAVDLGGTSTGATLIDGDGNVLLNVSAKASKGLLLALSRAQPSSPSGDATAYIDSLLANTSHIDIRGLIVGSGKATRLDIEDLYIPLKTTLVEAEKREGKSRGAVGELASVRVELRDALKHRVLLVVGDPGSGKTTFLRWIACRLCRSFLMAQREPRGRESRQFLLPVLIRVPDLIEHINEARARHQGPISGESHRWLAHYLAVQSRNGKWGLGSAYFEYCMERGLAMVLLDGLDEAPSREKRVKMVKLFESAARTYKDCKFVLTSRPAAFRDDVVKPDCVQVEIDDLEDKAVRTFLRSWCRALFTNSKQEAASHCRELTDALEAKPDIRNLARNPVMLTALAVVHWNEKRLPEQRAELYESILMWLARAREQLPGRPPPERCINLHQELALAMQDHPSGRQVQIGRYDAAKAIASQWRERPEDERFAAAEEFLKRDELDSGIVVSRGSELRFWHLTFQEYLAARALGARGDEEQRRRLLLHAKLYRPDWTEVVRLLGGVLHRQGPTRVDAMIASILDGLEKSNSLSHQASCFGLLGAVLQDLVPLYYQPCDRRYADLQTAVMGIFDAARSASVGIDETIDAAETLGRTGDPRFARPDANWIEIPGGDFLMGSQKERASEPNYDPDACDDEAPVHHVRLDAYKIGRYPVTVGEYRQFVDACGYLERRHWTFGGFGKFEMPGEWEKQLAHLTHPVAYVSWYEAAAYSVWAGCRLPTEPEWERAARGDDGRKYPWGNDEPNNGLLNFARRIGHTVPVGIYPRGASPYGLLDIAGNVWEWCNGRFTAYPSHGESDSTAEDGQIIRGGGWYDKPDYCRCAFRAKEPTRSRSSDVGFRVVLSATDVS